MSKTDHDRLIDLLSAHHPCVTIQSFEEEYALDVARHVAMTRRQDLLIWSRSVGLRDGMMKGLTPQPDTDHPAAALYKLLTEENPTRLVAMLDLVPHLKDERTLRLLRDLIIKWGDGGPAALLLIDATSGMPQVISNVSVQLDLSFPGEEELESILRRTVQKEMRASKVTAEIGRADLEMIVANLRGLTRRQARNAVMECIAADSHFDAEDVERVMQYKQKVLSTAGLLQFVQAPATLDDIGGLRQLKSWLTMRSGAFGDRANDFKLEAPRGVLLLGIQGAGKSLAAKAVATAWRRPLLRMDVGSLYNSYIGESERNLRDALKQAEMMAPVVLWIDEIEKAFASAAAQSTDGGLSKRMFGTLLTWMQEHTAPAFLIATANDIEALPPELMRKGRFDEIFFVDLPAPDARHAIFRIHLSRRDRDPKDFDLDQLVAESDGFTGAEIEQAIKSALYRAFATNSELSNGLIVESLRSSPPISVTMKHRIDRLRAWAADRCVPAD